MFNAHEHKPRCGDRFYDRSRYRDHLKPGEVPDARIDVKRQPNGYIINVDWDEQEIIVKFVSDPDVVTYSFDEIEDCWETDWGDRGCWMLYPQYSPRKK